MTCINNTESWQGKLVLNVLWPSLSLILAPLLHTLTVFLGPDGLCYRPSPKLYKPVKTSSTIQSQGFLFRHFQFP